jgi:hypothetical protein
MIIDTQILFKNNPKLLKLIKERHFCHISKNHQKFEIQKIIKDSICFTNFRTPSSYLNIPQPLTKHKFVAVTRRASYPSFHTLNLIFFYHFLLVRIRYAVLKDDRVTRKL